MTFTFFGLLLHTLQCTILRNVTKMDFVVTLTTGSKKTVTVLEWPPGACWPRLCLERQSDSRSLDFHSVTNRKVEHEPKSEDDSLLVEPELKVGLDQYTYTYMYKSRPLTSI